MKIKQRDFSGSISPRITEREIQNRKIAYKAAIEGIVLLENQENLLPLKKDIKIALYGAGAVKTVKGGTGSGDVNARDSITIYQGLKNAGYTITSEKWLFSYENLYKQTREKWKEEILSELRETGDAFFHVCSRHPFHLPEGALLDVASARCDGADIALFVLSRIAGENADVKDIPGEYYLTSDEEAMLEKISQAYEKIILVINTGNLIDISFVDKHPKIKSILFMVQAGQEGGSALAAIISGDVTPSGKLTDSWAFAYEDYPNARNFSYKNGDVLTEKYEEGIFVGYRYFDTFNVPVRYCFGHGLSYTDFEIEIKNIEADSKTNTAIAIKTICTVKNVGSTYAGKEVIQIYVSCPQGKLTKEFRRLVGFCKTNILQPGEMEEVEITFLMDQLTSYDEAQTSWILEEGEYGIWIGNSLENANMVGMLQIDGTHVSTICRNVCKLQKELTELYPTPKMLALRESAWKCKQKTHSLPIIQFDAKDMATKRFDYSAIDTMDKSIKALVATLSKDQLIALVTGDPYKGQGSMLGASGITVPGSAGETSDIAACEPWNIASIVLADGPAGLRLNRTYQVLDGVVLTEGTLAFFEDEFWAPQKEIAGTTYYQYCTAIPVGTLLAQTWNIALLEEIGKMIGSEMQLFNVSLWLAPGMNIHRNPLCGRNFEYYSEDPFLTGIVAASITKGVQKVPGCGTTIKHFACNNQEDNRRGSDSVLSERTLREIYLKGFEIAIKNSRPMAIMTSYNMINGVHTANSYDLCTKIAREEWGFQGVIMTDWTTTNNTQIGECTASGCIRAGNDLIMPGMLEDHEDIRKALSDGTLCVEQLRNSVMNIVRIIRASNQYEGAVSYYHIK